MEDEPDPEDENPNVFAHKDNIRGGHYSRLKVGDCVSYKLEWDDRKDRWHAVNIIYRSEISKTKDQDTRRKELITEYQDKFTTPYIAAGRGFLDDVIDPADTRVRIIKALEMLQNKRDSLPAKKHGNIPL